MAPRHIVSSYLISLVILVAGLAGCRTLYTDRGYMGPMYWSEKFPQAVHPPIEFFFANNKTEANVAEPTPATTQGKDFRSDYEYSENGGGWFKFHDIPATWEEARFRCHAEGGVLASPLSNDLKEAIVSFVKRQNNPYTILRIFSGVHATYSKGDFSSVEGVPLRHLAVRWARGEPKNFKDSENCLAMYIDNGTMAVEECGQVLPYVCYKKYTELTITECGTSDSEYVLSPITGSCYKFHGRSQVWSQAYTTCEAEGGHLAVINSDEEAKLIKDMYQAQPDSAISHSDYYRVLAVGFRDTGVHQNFMTIHGQTLAEAGFNRWHPGKPDNLTNAKTGDYGEFCGSIMKATGLLNDAYCHIPIPFICEKHPKSLRPDATWEHFVQHETLDEHRQSKVVSTTPKDDPPTTPRDDQVTTPSDDQQTTPTDADNYYEKLIQAAIDELDNYSGYDSE